MLEYEKQEWPMEAHTIKEKHQVGGFGDLLLVERRGPTMIRAVGLLSSRDAEFLVAAHNACLGLTLGELKTFANGKLAKLVKETEL